MIRLRKTPSVVQLISSPDGVLGVCYEHSVAEGIAVVAVLTDILKKVEEGGGESFARMKDEEFSAKISEVKFNFNEEIGKRVGEAMEDFKL